MIQPEQIRTRRARWVSRLLLASLLLGLGMVLAQVARGATTTKVAYVFDFGSGVSDPLGSSNGTVPPGSSIFTNILTGGPLPNGGTYNGATFTNVPIATIDSNPTTALSGFDTVLLYEVCSIGTHPTALGAINQFLVSGGKVIILDADRCASGPTAAGPADWSGFHFPFVTTGPGPTGGSGSYTFIEPSTLTAGLANPVPNDAVADANVFTSAAGAWCTSITATNLIPKTGRVEAYARTASGGLAIYSGEDFWFTFDAANAHLKTVFDNILAQVFNPDGLPCTNPASGIRLDPVTATNPIGAMHTVTATVVDINGVPQAGVTVTFTVVSGPDAGLTGTGTTNSAGHATFTFTDTTVPGTDVIDASFTDSSGIVEHSNPASKIWTQAPTTLTYVGDTTSDFHDPATVSATLASAVTNAPISGAAVSFTLGGTDTCTGTTGGTGTASCIITPTLAAGPYPLVASFAGNANFLASDVTTTFTVTLEETTLTYTGPTVIANGQSATLSGILKEDGITPIAGRTVSFTLGSGSSAQSCTGTTNATGTASCPIGTVAQPLGPGTVSADFAGDAFYLPSSDSKATLLFAFLARGSFVIGDKSDTGNVTFWSSQWAKVNTLSGGKAPSSFKGFANVLSSHPPSCGGTWSTPPGNSPPPIKGPLPSYMAVLVTSSVDKVGPMISGNTPMIVIVKTDPGYAPNPGHRGTGSVVAVLCQ